jgi:hypothetical protein
MSEKYSANLLSTAEAAQPVVEATSRISKIRRLKQRLGRSTVLSQVDSSNLPEAEDSSLGTTTDLDHGIALEPNPEVPDHEVETQEAASYREKLKRPTPKEQALLSGNITHKEDRAGGVKYVELDNGEAGLYWPRPSSKYRNERATYLVDRSWQFGLVPTTVIREFTGSYGGKDEASFQEYIPDATDARKVPEFETLDQFQPDLYRLWILQYSIWHTDAHQGNVVVTDRIHAIDHAHAFWDDKERQAHRSMFTDFYGIQAPEEVIKEADSFLKDDVRQQVLLEQLKGLHYYDKDVEACLARMRHVAQILTTKGKIDTPEELAEYLPN